MVRKLSGRLATVAAATMVLAGFSEREAHAGAKPIEPSRRLALFAGNDANMASLRELSTVLVQSFGYAKPVELYGTSATQEAIRRGIDDLVRDAGQSDSLTVIIALPSVTLSRDDPFGQFLQAADGNVEQPWTLLPVGEIEKFIAGGAQAGTSLLVLPQCPGPLMKTSYCAESSRERTITTISICAGSRSEDDVVTRFIADATKALSEFAARPGSTSAGGTTVKALLASSREAYQAQIRQCPEWAPPFTFSVGQNRLASTFSALDREEPSDARLEAVEILVEVVKTEPADRASSTLAMAAGRLADMLFDSTEPLELRSRAAWGLGQLHTLPQVLIDRMAALVSSEGETPFLRTSTIDALTALGMPAATAALRSSLDRPTTAAVAGEVIGALGRLRDSESLALIINTATTGDERLRIAALGVLPAFGEANSNELNAHPAELHDALLSSLQHPSANVRRAALVFAGSTASFGTTGTILKLMADDPDLKVREAAAYALGRSVERREVDDSERALAVRRLLEASRESPAEVRSAALWGLGRVGGTKAESRLIDVVKSQKEPFAARVAAVEALGVIRSERSLPALSEILFEAGDDVKLRVAAAVALGAIGTPAAADALVQIISVQKTAPELRSAAKRAMENIKPSGASKDRLNHPSASVRLETVRNVGEARDPAFASTLIEKLNDPDTDVREATLIALIGVSDQPAVVELLTGTVANDADVMRRVGAARILGSSTVPAARSVLVGAIKDESPAVRAAATDALVRQWGAAGATADAPPDIRAALLITVRDTSTSVRRSSALALGMLRDPESEELLKQLTQDASPEVREAAFEALAQRTRLRK